MKNKKQHFIITVKKSDYKIVEAEGKSIALTHAYTSPGKLLVQVGINCLVVCALALTWFIEYIYA